MGIGIPCAETKCEDIARIRRAIGRNFVKCVVEIQTAALLGSAGTVGFSLVSRAFGLWVTRCGLLHTWQKFWGDRSAGVRAARVSGQVMAASVAAEVGLGAGAALDCAIPVN